MLAEWPQHSPEHAPRLTANGYGTSSALLGPPNPPRISRISPSLLHSHQQSSSKPTPSYAHTPNTPTSPPSLPPGVADVARSDADAALGALGRTRCPHGALQPSDDVIHGIQQELPCGALSLQTRAEPEPMAHGGARRGQARRGPRRGPRRKHPIWIHVGRSRRVFVLPLKKHSLKVKQTCQ